MSCVPRPLVPVLGRSTRMCPSSYGIVCPRERWMTRPQFSTGTASGAIVRLRTSLAPSVVSLFTSWFTWCLGLPVPEDVRALTPFSQHGFVNFFLSIVPDVGL
ncbi:hypothetical protein QAD02_013864 [Eretmocerus hayati]|uniref:Uncharacterized protein n=1 Tax=Eretmocerus hayati TaxID=131215 RepID=A0ACC2P3X8_9HYME|nr:hypothetical protein QAD02_013864 [Eretmocerus hayati]